MAQRGQMRQTVAIATALAAALWTPVAAHDVHVVGPFRLEIGWGDEPAFAGVRNSVVAEISDAAGRGPVTDLGGSSLTVEIAFGTERVVLPMQPSGERRNEFRAWLVPTRPGTYALHITGRLKDQNVDITSTCSDKTFDCVGDLTDIQFPAKDPSVGQLAERVDRAIPRAEQAVGAATGARSLAVAALALSAFALVVSLGFGLRKKR